MARKLGEAHAILSHGSLGLTWPLDHFGTFGRCPERDLKFMTRIIIIGIMTHVINQVEGESR